MKRILNKKFGLAGGFAVAAAVLAAQAVIPVYAATSNTVVNAVLASTVSVTSTGPVNINITPTTTGSQTSASDTVTVATNDPKGYNLKLEDNDATLTLAGPSSNTLAATSGTYAGPLALDNNSWGWAVGGLGTFDASYSVLPNVASSATKWAKIPANGSGQQIASNTATTTGAVTTVWYSAKADLSKPTGTYTDTVIYTATVNP